MNWCRFERDGVSSYGMVEGDRVVAVKGTPFGAYDITRTTFDLAAVKLLVPTWPTTFYCVGVNYAEHIRKMAAATGREPVFPAKPDIGYRSNNALIAHEENIVKPRDAGPHLQYEGELVAVFGKKARNVSPDEALGCVLGWTIGNDVSERSWQASDRTLWRAKNTDTFKPMGPWISTTASLQDMQTTVRLNGVVSSTFETNKMLFDAATYISAVSRYCTIHPGDVMWMGTDEIPADMKPGDVVEVEITGIGTLRNYVVSED